jgi:hypothetical protein
MFRASWKLSSRHVDTVTITFQATPPFEVELDADEIDSLLNSLGELRAMMQPTHPLYFTKHQDVNFIVDPRWAYEQEPILDQSVLRIRDPRYGWLHYVVPHDTASKLAEALTSQANPPVLSPSKH